MTQRTLYKHLMCVCLLFYFTDIYTQVTIGVSEKPAEGAMLQLKNIPSVANGDANSNKGLLMPRVKLSDINSLADINNSSNSTVSLDPKEHIGLVVYNINDNSSTIGTLKEGMYMWDGQSWQPFGLSDVQGFGPWYQVDNVEIPSRSKDTDSYLEGKAVIGGREIIDNAALSIYGSVVVKTPNSVDNNEPSAILNLQSEDKGLLLPKVHLKGGDDKITIKDPAKGLVVYNTNQALLKGEGFYINYGDKNNPEWVGFISNLPDAPERYEIGYFRSELASKRVNFTAPPRASTTPSSPSTIKDDIDLGIEIDLTVPPMSQNQIVVTYSLPAGNTYATEQSGTAGYIGVKFSRALGTGTYSEIESGSRKYAIIPLNHKIFMVTVGATTVDYVTNSSPNPMVVKYKLNGYVEQNGTQQISAVFNMYKPTANSTEQNYNWGIGAITVQAYNKAIK